MFCCLFDTALKRHNTSVWICLQKVCKACILLEGLNRGLPGLGIRRVKQDAAGADGIAPQERLS
jgi:Zinc-ribbon